VVVRGGFRDSHGAELGPQAETALDRVGPVNSCPPGAETLLRLSGWRRPRIVLLQKIRRATQESWIKIGISDSVALEQSAACGGVGNSDKINRPSAADLQITVEFVTGRRVEFVNPARVI
jgi:hypothetical protein